MDIVWDEAKAQSNLRKHGVSFEEAKAVFRDSLSDTSDDPDHSGEEDRFIILGMNAASRLLYVSFTIRDNAIRLISARQSTKKERKLYENQS